MARGLRGGDEIDSAWNIMGWILFDRINSGSQKQREALYPALLGKKQKEIARDLGVGPSAVSQRLNSVRWKQIQACLNWMGMRLG